MASEALVEINALLGRGTSYAGKLHFDGLVRIEGQFYGEIRGEDVLVIAEGADVRADIEVAACIVTGGTVQGNIRARDAIELHAPAIVTGDLQAPAIFIDRGAQFEGNCKMAPLGQGANGEAPNAASAPAQLADPSGGAATIPGKPLAAPGAEQPSAPGLEPSARGADRAAEPKNTPSSKHD